MEPELYRTSIHKFSCKPPGHDAARQRENQRRHRARVKDRIADLEAALSSTQGKLEDALRHIENLTTEIQRLHALGLHSSAPQRTAAADQGPALELSTCNQRGIPVDNDHTTQQEHAGSGSCPETGDVCGTPQTCTATPSEAIEAGDSSLTVPDTESVHDIGVPVLVEGTGAQTNVVPISDLSNPDNDCPLLPAPAAGESTIPCRDAYSIIKERSTPEFDLSVANEWLKPGFRRAVVPGTGCRVQTHILFAFVDRITPI